MRGFRCCCERETQWSQPSYFNGVKIIACRQVIPKHQSRSFVTEPAYCICIISNRSNSWINWEEIVIQGLSCSKDSIKKYLQVWNCSWSCVRHAKGHTAWICISPKLSHFLLEISCQAAKLNIKDSRGFLFWAGEKKETSDDYQTNMPVSTREDVEYTMLYRLLLLRQKSFVCFIFKSYTMITWV